MVVLRLSRGRGDMGSRIYLLRRACGVKALRCVLDQSKQEAKVPLRHTRST
jgi:hypothetical protein